MLWIKSVGKFIDPFSFKGSLCQINTFGAQLWIEPSMDSFHTWPDQRSSLSSNVLEKFGFFGLCSCYENVEAERTPYHVEIVVLNDCISKKIWMVIEKKKKKPNERQDLNMRNTLRNANLLWKTSS